MNELQSAVASAGTRGAPHLRHKPLFQMTVEELQALTCDGSWLDIGAGHGAFAAIPAEAGMKVVVTEMSESALSMLRDRYIDSPNVDVRRATDSDPGLAQGERFDVISMISVIHHIPDFEKVIEDLIENHLQAGGAIVTFQDPPYYPRLSAFGAGFASVTRATGCVWQLVRWRSQRSWFMASSILQTGGALFY